MFNNTVVFTMQVWSDLRAAQVSAKRHNYPFWSSSLQCLICVYFPFRDSHFNSYSILIILSISPHTLSLRLSVRLPPSFPCEAWLWKYLECTQFAGRWGLLSLSLTYLQAYAKGGGERLHTQRCLCLHTLTHTHTHTHTHTLTGFHVIKVCLSVCRSVHRLVKFQRQRIDLRTVCTYFHNHKCSHLLHK